jgi:hypothetical protein
MAIGHSTKLGNLSIAMAASGHSIRNLEISSKAVAVHQVDQAA